MNAIQVYQDFREATIKPRFYAMLQKREKLSIELDRIATLREKQKKQTRIDRIYINQFLAI